MIEQLSHRDSVTVRRCFGNVLRHIVIKMDRALVNELQYDSTQDVFGDRRDMKNSVGCDGDRVV